MKKLRITVEGKVYDVTVEVLEDDERIASEGVGLGAAPPATPRPPVPAPSPQAPSPQAVPVPPVGLPSKSDPRTLAAPLAGTVIKVFVQAGMEIEEKAPVCLMEAMKMETYIYAPRTGKLTEVCVKPGDVVQAGDALIRYAAER